MEKNVCNCLCCSGNLNWSPPKAATQGLIPPVPTAIKNKPIRENQLKKSKYNWLNHRIMIFQKIEYYLLRYAL